MTETENVCGYCRLPIEDGWHSPDYCVEWAGPECTIRVSAAGSMFTARPGRPAPVPPPLPVSLGRWVDPSVRDKAHGDRMRALASAPRPPWLPRPHVLPPEQLAVLMTADAAGVGHEALEIATYHLIEAASDARWERIRRRYDGPEFEPQLNRRRIEPCALCGRPGAVPGRVRCGPCTRASS